MTIHFSKEKWIEIQQCWKRIKNVINSNETATTTSATISVISSNKKPFGNKRFLVRFD